MLSVMTYVDYSVLAEGEEEEVQGIFEGEDLVVPLMDTD